MEGVVLRAATIIFMGAGFTNTVWENNNALCFWQEAILSFKAGESRLEKSNVACMWSDPEQFV